MDTSGVLSKNYFTTVFLWGVIAGVVSGLIGGLLTGVMAGIYYVLICYKTWTVRQAKWTATIQVLVTCMFGVWYLIFGLLNPLLLAYTILIPVALLIPKDH